MNIKHVRAIEFVVNGDKTSDGAGVQLNRLIGTQRLNMLDPFLLLDAFGSDQPSEYIGGFPSHPHRGFETVTYMLAGQMRHEDSVGNSGVIKTGGVQWMSAGKGIIHSEMPEQTDGFLAGLQLWINLPRADKMMPPTYQEFEQKDIPIDQNNSGALIRVIAGQTDHHVTGVINDSKVAAIYWDIELKENHQLIQHIPYEHNAFIYVIEGNVSVAESSQQLKTHELGVLSLGNRLNVTADTDSRFVFVAARPLNEPVARGGPFVMNSKEEIQQAFNDYKNGVLV